MKVIKDTETPFTEQPAFPSPVTKAPLGGSMETSCSKSSNGAEHIFFQPPLSILLPFTPYLQPLLTCLRVGRAGWLTGWLGAHGPRLWLE